MRILAFVAAAVLAASPVRAQLLAPAVRADLERSGRVHSLVLEHLEAAARIRVFLELDLTAAGAPAAQQQSWELRRPWVAAASTEVAGSLELEGFELTHRFQGISAVAGWIDAHAIEAALAHPWVARVLPDSAGHAALEQSLPLANLSDTRSAGFHGAGQKVAVIDSGADRNHPALDDAIVDEACFCSANCCPNGQDEQEGPGAAMDENGHGTNVTGVIASSGANGTPVGATPAVDVVLVRVLDENGSFSTTADIAAALDWIRAEHPDAAAVNMSLATNTIVQSHCDNTFTVLAQAAESVRDVGVLPVAATGNEGSATSMAAPACISDVMAVAAVWDANIGTSSIFCQEATAPDKITCFSNRNALTDILAPGAPVTSTGLGGGTSTYYGTSQASPMVAACAVAMRQSNEDVTTAQMVAAMKASPTMVHDSKSGQTFPRLDCLDAVLDVATTTTTTTLPIEPLCGDADGDGQVVASDALTVLHAAVGLVVSCPQVRCDFDGSGSVTASDSLSTLKRAVGQTVATGCLAEA
ncbi:MAG TPA: S8 family serine peptidase [Candidatus Binatia bacterium]|nr:S8 family serine peptidase [Candidatus Binatia bacterium]